MKSEIKGRWLKQEISDLVFLTIKGNVNNLLEKNFNFSSFYTGRGKSSATLIIPEVLIYKNDVTFFTIKNGNTD